jgi:hypothetical protein
MASVGFRGAFPQQSMRFDTVVDATCVNELQTNLPSATTRPCPVVFSNDASTFPIPGTWIFGSQPLRCFKPRT